ncbi:MAG: MBL fold metallo-hydrolase [Dehalococcoidales bacterium]
MKIKWLGHAAFLITADNGTRIITDPYLPNEQLRYAEITETADIVTTSHEHGDHSNVAAVGGNPAVITATGEAKGIKFDGIPVYHDDSSGSQRGSNTIFCFEVDGIRVCHLGDLGHPLSDEEVKAVGRVDILLIPVGGFFTIDAAVATAVSDRLSPRIVIPMHVRNDRCSFPIAGVDDFLKGKDNVTKLDVSEVEFHSSQLPGVTQIVVPEPAL